MIGFSGRTRIIQGALYQAFRALRFSFQAKDENNVVREDLATAAMALCDALMLSGPDAESYGEYIQRKQAALEARVKWWEE